MADVFIEDIKRIYESIPETYSKRIFERRLLYSLTADRNFIQSIVSETPEGIKLEKRMDCYKRFILFGGGVWGGNILWAYSKKNWLFVWDNNPKKQILVSDNKGFSDEKIELPIEKYVPGKIIDSDIAIVISSRLYHKEIYNQLISDGVPADNIIDVGGMVDDMSKRQYFDLPQMKKTEHEVFVDAGAFDGETAISFMDWCDNKGVVFAFEPEEKNAALCQKKLEERFKTVQMTMCGGVCRVGLWDKKETLHFSSGKNGSSKISPDGDMSINVDCLDNLLKDEDVTFIKMDLEGAECKALFGAKETIQKCKPKLAISLYHKPDDVWKIPKLILSFNPEYKFYLRHYSIAASETVLYAL